MVRQNAPGQSCFCVSSLTLMARPIVINLVISFAVSFYRIA